MTPELAAERAADILAIAEHADNDRAIALVAVADGWTRLHDVLANAPKTPTSTSGLTATEELAKMSDAYRTQLAAVRKVCEVRDIQGQHGTWNASGYMRGLYNGLELALSILEGERDPEYKDEPADGYLCDRPTPDMSGPEFEPVSDDAAGTPPAGDR